MISRIVANVGFCLDCYGDVLQVSSHLQGYYSEAVTESRMENREEAKKEGGRTFTFADGGPLGTS